MFKGPCKAPNEELVRLDRNDRIEWLVPKSFLHFPLLASSKKDGFRMIFHNCHQLTCSLKEIVNLQVREKFADLCSLAGRENILLDGELFSPELTFQDISSYATTKDHNDPKTIKKYGVRTIPDHLRFYCFDSLDREKLGEPFQNRIQRVYEFLSRANMTSLAEPIIHKLVYSIEELEDWFYSEINAGGEGLFLRDPRGRYKCGRATMNEGLCYKMKPFSTFDAQIKGFEQATEVNEGVEKKINELGKSVTSKKKGDRHNIESCSGLIVDFEGKDLTVPTSALTHEKRIEIWANREQYLGRWIEYKALKVGMKKNGKLRIPVFVRWREDKD